jgi:hypothetical protein
MEKVSGIGGLFFRARDPVAIGQWYPSKGQQGRKNFAAVFRYPSQKVLVFEFCPLPGTRSFGVESY